MTDPHEIIEAALADAHDIGMTDALYSKAVVRALEAKFVIVDPDNVTDEMAQASFDAVARVFREEGCEPNISDWRVAISAALRAAPKWSEKK